MKKLIDSDWLKYNREFYKPMTSSKMMMNILCKNFEKGLFLEREKMASEERSSGTSFTQMFSCL